MPVTLPLVFLTKNLAKISENTQKKMDSEQFKTEWLPTFLTQFKKLDSCQKETTIHSLLEILESKEKFILQSYLPDMLYRDFITQLPYEILERIIDFLDLEDILNSCMVSKSWCDRLSHFSRYLLHFKIKCQ